MAFIEKPFLPPFFPLLSLFGLQTELKQQLHTPDAQSIGQGTFCCGGNKQGLTLQGNRTPQWSSPPSRLFWALSPLIHVPSHTSLMPPPLPVFPFLSAVDRAWEYLLCSCCCQQFWLKEQQPTGKSNMQIKVRINLSTCVIWCRRDGSHHPQSV